MLNLLLIIVDDSSVNDNDGNIDDHDDNIDDADDDEWVRNHAWTGPESTALRKWFELLQGFRPLSCTVKQGKNWPEIDLHF